MKEFAVWLTKNDRDVRIGKVTAESEDHAMSLIPEKYFKMGKVGLVEIVIE